MTDTIKTFLEADAKRTQGEWIACRTMYKGNTEGFRMACDKFGSGTPVVECLGGQGVIPYAEIDGNANFIALASTLAPAIRTMLADIEMASKALNDADIWMGFRAESANRLDALLEARNKVSKALSALDKYKGGV